MKHYVVFISLGMGGKGLYIFFVVFIRGGMGKRVAYTCIYILLFLLWKGRVVYIISCLPFREEGEKG